MPAAIRTRSSEVTCPGRLDSISVVLSTTTWTVSLSTGCITLNPLLSKLVFQSVLGGLS